MKEIIGQDNLIGGVSFPLMVETMKLKTGNYKRGQLVEIDDTGVLKDCTDVTKVFGIIADDKICKADNEKGTIYISGIFNQNAMKIGDGIDREKLKIEGRKINIYFSK